MTESSWDKHQLETQFTDCKSLRDVIQRLESEFSNKGEVICEIRVNGMIFDESDEARFATSAIEEIHDLAIRSNRPSDLIGEALQSAIEFLPRLEEHSLRTADLLRGSDLPRARQAFTQTIEGCQWLVETLVHVRGAAKGTGTPIAKADAWSAAEAATTRAIHEVSEAFERDDQTLVADLLEYELSSAVTQWKEALQAEIERRELPGSSTADHGMDHR